MEPAGFQNLGYGYDRIENVLWRIYHGELDGYEADKVVLMIGTNNMGISPDKDIVEGLRFLIRAIRNRQPKATVKMIGILPRREHEDWVKTSTGKSAQWQTRKTACSAMPEPPCSCPPARSTNRFSTTACIRTRKDIS